MSHREPGWGIVDAEIDASIDFTQTDRSFEVALGSRLRKGWGEVRARSFASKGTVRLLGDWVTIRTSASRLFGASIDTKLDLRCADIYNVRVKGKLVQFELLNGPGELEPIILRARNKSEAASIAAAMPGQMTSRYATENKERLRFLEQITARAPHLWATWTLVAATSLVFVAMVASGAGLMTVKPAFAIAAGSNFGPYTLGGQWWRLFSSVFIHFGLAHFAFNMIVLAQTGRIAERLFGSARFMAIYLFSGLTGSLMSLLWRPGVNSAGASGAIFGVLGGLLAYVIVCHESIPRAIFLRHFRWAAAFICYNLIWGFTHHGIDNGAHVGGLIGGFMLACVLALPVDSPDSPRLRPAMTLAMAGVLAGVLVGSLIWMLSSLSTRPDRQAASHFSEVMQQLGPMETRAVEDIKVLAKEPQTAQARADYARHIRTTVLPEWNQLYATLNNTQVSPGSADAATKDHLLRYYGDISEAVQKLANMADNGRVDSTTKAEIQALMADAKRQRAALKNEAAPR